MNAIKEFLKPNWWKVAPVLLFAIIVTLMGTISREKVVIIDILIDFKGYLFISYILSCLIYSIITKIKRLIAK